MITVKTSDMDTHKFPTGRKFKFKSFRKYLYIYDYYEDNIAVFKLSEVIGWWEE